MLLNFCFLLVLLAQGCEWSHCVCILLDLHDLCQANLSLFLFQYAKSVSSLWMWVWASRIHLLISRCQLNWSILRWGQFWLQNICRKDSLSNSTFASCLSRQIIFCSTSFGLCTNQCPLLHYRWVGAITSVWSVPLNLSRNRYAKNRIRGNCVRSVNATSVLCITARVWLSNVFDNHSWLAVLLCCVSLFERCP